MDARHLNYTAQDGTQLHSRLYLPANTDQAHAGVLVFPEWWGVGEHVLHSAERLAHSGYAALAVDLYGNGLLTDKAEEANRHMSHLLSHPEKLVERCDLALAALRHADNVDGTRIAAIGFCFGGRVVLDMARRGADVNAVASFHGILATDTPARAGAVKAAILVEHAGGDSMVGMDDVAAFRAEMDAAGADYRIDVFEHAKHGFTNPQATANGERNGVDLAYNADAAADAWVNMLAFFGKHL
ncbi:dienelactone hydrolase family protein [Conchiformibius kuhniae]|uniref:Dienelactone hydrolase family protein n=1 Tax=Conchiformibius kuhniae TaxID=211502 RepID=A0A8T9MT01_9NEIS|nr:dienelactone hydrolase family protein [Conchiformibius kuhniae]UOP04214.1 dienelactone hydrolase family protein [Conchiformibius kuhniae]